MEPIPHHLLERARRTAARRIAAALVTCMADTDASFENIGRRLDREEAVVRAWLYDLIDGKTGAASLDRMSDFALAMATELTPSARPATFLSEPEPEAQAA